VNVAKLKYEIDSSQTKTAKTNLDGMTRASKDAKAAQSGLATTATRAGRDITAANTNVARSGALVTKAYTAMRAAVIAAIVGITAGLIGLTSLMTRFVSSSVEAQKQQAQLASAIRSTGGAAGQTLASLNAHAAALQKVTNFGDEATNSAQGLLLTFTKIRGDTFERATAAVQDVATAMGQDLKGAAIQVGKALNDPVLGMTALSRSGITFTEAQKELVKSMVASGDMLGAQNLILKELETQFGGSARAARETLGGALTALGNAWGDLFEKSGVATSGLRLSIEGLVTAISNPAFAAFMNMIGSVLFGILQAATLAATGLANAVIFLADNIDTIGVAAGTAGTLMLAYFGVSVLGPMAVAFGYFGAAGVAAIRAIGFAIAANPIGALALAITAAVTAIYVFRDEINKALGIDVVQTAKFAANTLIGSFVAAYEDIKFVWKSFPDIIGAATVGAANLSISGIELMLNKSAQLLDGFITKVNGALSMLPGGLNIGTIGQIDIGRIANPYADALSGAVSKRNAAVSDAMSFDYIGAIGNTFKESTPDVQAFNAAVNQVEQSATGAGGALKKAATDAKDPWKGLRGDVDKAKESLNFAKDAARGFLSDLRQGLMNGEGFWKSFGKAALNVLDKIINKIEDQLVNALFSANSAGSGGGLLGGGGGLFGSILGGIGKLFGFAKGTNYAPGGVAMVGEEGPELVELPRGSKVNTANETRRMMNPANSNNSGGGSSDVVTIVLRDDSGRMASIADQQIQTRSGTIVQVAVEQSRGQIMPTVADYQGNRAGSDYRTT
jgi:hypothetical protein